MNEIDWSTFDDLPESTCTCRCVFAALKDGDEIPTFRSHVKFRDGRLHLRKPCPQCGHTGNIQSARSDPESF